MERNWRKGSRGSADGTTWDPHPNDELTGKLLAVRAVTTRYGKRAIADIEAENDGGTMNAWVTAASLKRQWAELRPRVGDTVRLTYHGKGTTDGGQEYHDYQMEVADGAKGDVGPVTSAEVEDEEARGGPSLAGDEPPAHTDQDAAPPMGGDDLTF